MGNLKLSFNIVVVKENCLLSLIIQNKKMSCFIKPHVVWMHLVGEVVRRLLDFHYLEITQKKNCKILLLTWYLKNNIDFCITNCIYFRVTNSKGQKVPKGFVEGIKGNLDLMPTYYPGWVMRLYIDYDLDDPIIRKLCNLACKPQYSNLDICHVKQLPGTPLKDARKIFPMNWRFFPTLDPQVFTNSWGIISSTLLA